MKVWGAADTARRALARIQGNSEGFGCDFSLPFLLSFGVSLGKGIISRSCNPVAQVSGSGRQRERSHLLVSVSWS